MPETDCHAFPPQNTEELHCPEILCPACWSPSRAHPHNQILLLSLQFGLFQDSYNWNHTLCTLFRPASPTQQHVIEVSRSFHGKIGPFLLSLNNIPLSGGTTVHSATEGHCGRVQVFAIMNKTATNMCVPFLFGREFFIWVNTAECASWILDHAGRRHCTS